jgi:hypothetical protein
MNNHKEITYKLVLKTPMFVNYYDIGEKLVIPAAAIRGVAKAEFQYRTTLMQFGQSDTSENLLFGGEKVRVDFTFTDAVCSTPPSLNERNFVSLDRMTGAVDGRKNVSRVTVPAGTEFIGKVCFGEKPDGIQRSIALTAILDIARLGSRRSSGYGTCDVFIQNRSSTIIFISYSWEDQDHRLWVLSLAKRLIDSGIDVVLDRLSSTFYETAPQFEINKWMIQAINNSDRILAVLTPKYKQKSEQGLGGVGFEYTHILSEQGRVSKRLERYIGVLRSGDTYESVPHCLKDSPIVDLRPNLDTELGISTLMKAILA